LDLKDSTNRTAHFGLVDVPGHHAFIRNMLAGAGGIDCVLLVIAADEGVKAQTIEHLDICTLLGIRHGLVALTKRDTVTPDRLAEAQREARAFLKHSFLESAPILPVSAFTGEGLNELKSALIDLALHIPTHSMDTLLRLPLDRAFSISGFGTVVTGTLRDGSLTPGDTVELQPAAKDVRVRGIQVHHRAVRQAHAPTRVALNLAGIEVDDVHRGDIIIRKGTLTPVTTIDVELTILPHARAPRHRSRVEVHAFTTDSPATLLLYESSAPNTPQLARLRLARPMLLVPGDRFVLRMPDPANIIGGGRVLDSYPLRRLRKTPTFQWLTLIRNAPPDQQLLARIRRRALEGITLPTLGLETGLRAEAISRLLAPSIAAGHIITTKVESIDRYLDPASLTRATDLILKELQRRESRSSSRAELLSRTRLTDWVFDLTLRQLTQTSRIRITGSEIALPGADPNTAQQQQLLARVEDLYRTSGLATPLVAEAALTLKIPPKDLSPLIAQLLRTGKLIRMGSDTLLLHADSLAKLKSDLAKLRGQTLDVARFKDLTGLTRKHAIPLLEHLDRLRLTLNNQGLRKVL
jgi:selenocysteine-specific elongation factor